MTKLFETIIPEAQQDLIRDNMIELVTVSVEALPHPDRPEDRSAMQIAAEVYYDFRDGIPRIDNAIGRIRRTASMAEEDLSFETKNLLLAALEKRCREMKEVREGKLGGMPVESLVGPGLAKEMFGPEFIDLNSRILVWCYGWNAGMDDDGKMIVDTESPLLFEGMDDESRARVLERVRKVDAAIGATVYELMQEG